MRHLPKNQVNDSGPFKTTMLDIRCDRGKEFRSKIWDSICELLDIDRVNTTPWHPQGDGQSEKSVQQKMIREHVDEDQESWALGIAQLCFAYNSNVHEKKRFHTFLHNVRLF